MPEPSAEQVVTEAYENVVKKKQDLKLADTYLGAEVDRKQRLVIELKKEIEFLEQKRRGLSEAVQAERKGMIDAIEERRLLTEKKLTETQAILEYTARERNFLEQEKSNVIGLRQQLSASKNQADDLIKRVQDFASTIR